MNNEKSLTMNNINEQQVKEALEWTKDKYKIKLCYREDNHENKEESSQEKFWIYAGRIGYGVTMLIREDLFDHLWQESQRTKHQEEKDGDGYSYIKIKGWLLKEALENLLAKIRKNKLQMLIT